MTLHRTPYLRRAFIARMGALSLAVLTGALAAAESAPVVFGFHQIPTNTPQSQRLAGVVLLTELGCLNCHQSGAALSVTGGKLGPDLRRTGDYKDGYLESWLAAPHRVKPGTTMPDLLAGFSPPERERTAADLAAYLRALTPVESATEALPKPDAAQGAALYHSIGCVACHQPFQPPPASESNPANAKQSPPTLPSVPLGPLDAKYTLQRLAEFLRDPHAARPAGRMPSFGLSLAEADNLSAWLLQNEPPKREVKIATASRGDAVVGRAHFQTLRCAACHELPGDPQSKAQTKPLAELRWDTPRGCVSPTPQMGVPHFALSSQQLESLRAAVTAHSAGPLNEPERLQAGVLALGCTACHVRNGLGGPESARAAYFDGLGDDLGDEGRFPPRLSHAGYKFLPPALTGIVATGIKLRPYLKTRMPAFGGSLATPLAAAFEQCDLPPDLKPLEQRGRNEKGRQLLGTSGMSCITCHPLNGHKSLGIASVDLAKTIGRLRPEWLLDFMVNPAAFNPGTRMPAFWPDAKRDKVWPDVDAIRVYLLEAAQSRLPEGLKQSQSYELIPRERPIVFRTFMREAGMQAVAVGFPQGVHAAFDAETSTWALAWKGKFLDAEPTWFERANPPVSPLAAM